MKKGGKSSLYETLKRQILTLELAPDQDLDEASLSGQYGISRTPVREVLRRLAGEGYVDIRENRGARVIPMNLMTLRDFFLVAPMVYEAVGRLAVQNCKPAQLKELKACQERFRSAMKSGDGEKLNIENNRFHAIIGEMANSLYLRPSLERVLIDHARIGHTFFHPNDKAMADNLLTACKHHDQFIEAIAGRDEAAMAQLVFDHWELSRRNMERYVAPAQLRNDAVERIAKPRSRKAA
ncbi:MAG: GntR family transcriptional regulator [Pseudomonadota bacterium]|nr:GntR family transcriptional regulator [Pseudomonadota bacterium]